MDISAIIQSAIGIGITLVGFLWKRGMEEDRRRQEENRQEANKRLDVIQSDLKLLVGAFSDARADHRVLEERFRKCEADTSVQHDRMRKAEEEISLGRNRYHELAGKVQVILARMGMDRRAAPTDEAPTS